MLGNGGPGNPPLAHLQASPSKRYIFGFTNTIHYIHNMNQEQINDMLMMLSIIELQHIQKQIKKEIERRKKIKK